MIHFPYLLCSSHFANVVISQIGAKEDSFAGETKRQHKVLNLANLTSVRSHVIFPSQPPPKNHSSSSRQRDTLPKPVVPPTVNLEDIPKKSSREEVVKGKKKVTTSEVDNPLYDPDMKFLHNIYHGA